MKIKINLDKHDWRNFQAYLEKALPSKIDSWMNRSWVNIVIWALFAIIFMSLFQRAFEFHWPTALFVGLIFALIILMFFINTMKMRKACDPSPDGIFCGVNRYIFTSDGIETVNDVSSGFVLWEAVQEIVRSNGMIMVFLDSVVAYVFPEDKLDEADDFYKIYVG